MSYYAAPVYLATTFTLCLSYSLMECIKDKGELDTATNSILFTWSIISIIVASVILAVTGEMMIGQTRIVHVIIALLLTCVTLIISSCMIYWAMPN